MKALKNKVLGWFLRRLEADNYTLWELLEEPSTLEEQVLIKEMIMGNQKWIRRIKGRM